MAEDTKTSIETGVRGTASVGGQTLFNTKTESTGEAPSITGEEQGDGGQGISMTSPEDYGFAPLASGEQQRATQYTQEDFYPNPVDPAQYGFSEGLQVIARPGRIPMGAFAKAAQSINQKQQDLNKKKQDIVTLQSKRFNVPSPYQEAFDKSQTNVLNQVIEEVRTYEGIDVSKTDKVYAKIARNPAYRNKLLEALRKNEREARLIQDNYNRAQQYVSEVTDPSKGYFRDPYLIETANNLIAPTIADLDEIKNSSQKFLLAQDLNNYFNKEVLQAAAQVGFKLESDPRIGTRTIVVTNTKDWEDFSKGQSAIIAQQAPESVRAYAQANGLPSGTKDQLQAAALHYLQKVLPVKVVKEVSNVPQDGGGGGGKQPTTPQVTASVKRSVTNPISPQYLQQSVVSFTPSEVTGNKLFPVASYPLSSGVGSPKSTGFPALQWDENAGEFNISALTLSTEVQDKIKQTMEDDSMSDDVKQREITRIMEGSPTNTYKLSQNRSFMADKYQTTDPYVVVSMSLAQSGISISPDELRMNWPRQDYRKQIMERLEGGSSAVPQPSELTYNPATGRLE